ncbi:hypothetical protein V8C35DRAFT_1311 [Trichoderma chlorosporum]
MKHYSAMEGDRGGLIRRAQEQAAFNVEAYCAFAGWCVVFVACTSTYRLSSHLKQTDDAVRKCCLLRHQLRSANKKKKKKKKGKTLDGWMLIASGCPSPTSNRSVAESRPNPCLRGTAWRGKKGVPGRQISRGVHSTTAPPMPIHFSYHGPRQQRHRLCQDARTHV